jgi:hypothetical protein
MADAGGADLEQYLRALGHGGGRIHFLQGLAEVDDAIALHDVSSWDGLIS